MAEKLRDQKLPYYVELNQGHRATRSPETREVTRRQSRARQSGDDEADANDPRTSSKRAKIARVLPVHRGHPLKLYRPTRLAKLLGVDPSTIWRWRREGVLPPPVQIGGIKGWTEHQLKQLIEQRQQEAGDAQN